MLTSCRVHRNKNTNKIDKVVIDRPFTDERASVIYNYFKSKGIPIQLGKEAVQRGLIERGYNLNLNTEVYGFVTPEGEMYIDPDLAGVNTLIHEGAHIHYKVLQEASRAGDVKAQAVLNKINDITTSTVDKIYNSKTKQTNVRDIQTYITPATIRNFNEETLRLKELTDEYNNIAKEISQGNLENQERFVSLQREILDEYQNHIQDKVSEIPGVSVDFKSPYLGSWHGNYEPSLNMTLSITPNADTMALSELLFSMAENTSQDAFILEEASEIEDRMPLTEFDNKGMMHYPQIRVSFNSQLSVAEKSIIAQRLKSSGVEEFSIDGDYFIISVIDFNSENYEQKEEYYAKVETTIATLFRGEGETVGTNNVKNVQVYPRKSKYVGARNEGDEQAQTREYDRSDLFETQTVTEQLSETTTEQEPQQIETGLLGSPVYNQLENETPEQYRERLREEVYATLLGNNAEQYLEEAGLTKKEAKSLLQRAQEFIEEIVDWIQGKKGFQDLSVEDIKEMTILDFLDRSTSSMMLGEFGTLQTTYDVSDQTTDSMMFLADSDLDINGNPRPEVLREIANEKARIKTEAQANGTWMKAPNGETTNLVEEQWVAVRTERFKKWFGDWENNPENSSKVVDENGEPLVVYHGTEAEFTEFLLRGRRIPALGLGFYFTPNINKAKDYGGNIMDVFLNIRNPLDWGKLSEGDRLKIIERLNDIVPNDAKIYGKVKSAPVSREDLRNKNKEVYKRIEEARKKGGDLFKNDDGSFEIRWRELGIDDANDYQLLGLAQKYDNNIGEVLGYDAVTFRDETVVFNSNQIKSAVDNVGTFSEQSNDIRFQVGQRTAFDPVLGRAIQQKLQELYPEIQLTITNKPIWEYSENIFNQRENKVLLLQALRDFEIETAPVHTNPEEVAYTKIEGVQDFYESDLDIYEIVENYERAMSRTSSYIGNLEGWLLTGIPNIYKPFTDDNSVLVGQMVEDIMLVSHFAPSSLRKGLELIKRASESNVPIVMAVPEYQSQQLEKAGFRFLTEVPQYFAGEIITKKVMVNDSVQDQEIQALYDYFEDSLNNFNQQTFEGQIIGQANIEAGTVLIDLLNQKQDTLPHEYAHHYIAWFRNAPIVQEAIKKWGSEEALVQSIGEQVVAQKGEALQWWNQFVDWIKKQFKKLSKTKKEELTQLLTNAFLTRTDPNILTPSDVFVPDTVAVQTKQGDILAVSSADISTEYTENGDTVFYTNPAGEKIEVENLQTLPFTEESETYQNLLSIPTLNTENALDVYSNLYSTQMYDWTSRSDQNNCK